MIKRLLSAIGLGREIAPAGPRFAPYGNTAADFMYNLLFCDDRELFRPPGGTEREPWRTLFAEPPNAGALRVLAADRQQEGRVRALAFGRLRELGEAGPAKELLGVVIEHPLEGGLDTLAAYSDGGARYINHTGKMCVIEERIPAVDERLRALLAAARPLVDQIGPWDKPRLPPPPVGAVRLSFLVSDGLYFGQGSPAALAKDPLGGAVLAAGARLLEVIVERTLSRQG